MSMRYLLLLSAALLPGIDLAASQASAPENSPARVRTFAATPDWAGFWETETADLLASPHGIKQLLGAAQRAPQTPTAASAGQRQSAAGDTPLPIELALMSRVQLLRKPPYQPRWERKYELAMKASAMRPLPLVCSVSFPLIMESPDGALGMFEAVVTPEEVLLVFDTGTVRHIYTDGRPHPKKEDLWPTDMGDSIGHWEGATLVIDTIERKPGPIFPQWPGPTADLSEQAHFIERLRRLGRDTLQDDLTIEDPQRLAHPWQVTIRYGRVQNLDRMIGGEVCENNRNQVINGKMIITPP
jgi:hypothetical protein